MKPIKKTLFFYSLTLTFVLFFQGLKQAKTGVDLILIMLLSAPTIYFLFSLVSLFKLPIFPRERLVTIASYLKTVSLVNCIFLFLISLFGLLFNFEYIFILIILPLPLYFWLADFNKDFIFVPKIKKAELKIEEKSAVSLPADTKNDPIKTKKISDPLKRQLIKTIGVSGVGLLIAAFLNPKKAEAAFFGSVPGPGTIAVKDSQGNKIDPAVKKPTDGYGICQIDDSAPAYYGYVDKDGNWYIIRENTVDTVESYLYIKGGDNFSYYWTNRSSLVGYDYFNNIF